MERLTHHSINSQAGVLFEIRKRGLDSWYEALRQAELFIEQKEAALEDLYFRQRKQERVQRKKQRRLDELKILVNLKPDDQDELEALNDEMEMAKSRVRRIQGPIQDALMELNTATAERDRIIEEHPEILDMTYEQKQAVFAGKALTNRLARYIAGRVWGQQTGFGESVGATVFELPLEMRQAVLDREVEMRMQLQLAGTKAEAAAMLATLPPEQQEAILAQATDFVLAAAEEINGQ